MGVGLHRRGRTSRHGRGRVSKYADRAPRRQFPATDGVWAAYARVCKALGVERAAQTLALVVAFIREHGDEEAQRLLEEGLAEHEQIRARQSPGRPKGSRNRNRKTADKETEHDPR